MSVGLGNIKFSNPPAAGGGGGGAVTAANDGVSLNGTTVVLGNDAGDIAAPGKLLNDRVIPMAGFSLDLIQTDLNTNFFSIDSSGTAMLNYFKGTLGQEPAEIITIQGQAPGANPYGNFWLTLDESLINPDLQRDAVMQWGYNQSGTGGRMNANEAAIWWSMESHFEVGGSTQFEIELASVRLDGTGNRYIQLDINKTSGGCIAMLAWDSLSISATNSSFLDNYFVLQGTTAQMELVGTAPIFTMTNTTPTSGQFSVVSNPDGSLNISNQTTGSDQQIRWSNPQVYDNPDPAFASLTIDLINSDGVQGLNVEGTVTAGSGFAYPAITAIDASGGVIIQSENIGVGDSFLVLRTATGGGNPQVQFSDHAAANVFTMGMLNVPDKFVMTNGNFVTTGNNLWTMTKTAQAGFGGNTAPTAFVHIAASGGTPGLGPLKLTAAPLLAVPEDGLIEYDGTNFWKTIGAVRTIIT